MPVRDFVRELSAVIPEDFGPGVRACIKASVIVVLSVASNLLPSVVELWDLLQA